MGLLCSSHCSCFACSRDYRLAKSILKKHCYENPKLQPCILNAADLCDDARRLVELRKCLHEYTRREETTSSYGDDEMILLKSDSVVLMLNTEQSRAFGSEERGEFRSLREDIVRFLVRDYDGGASALGFLNELNMTHLFSKPYYKYRLKQAQELEKMLPLHVCISLRHPFNNDPCLHMIYICIYHSS